MASNTADPFTHSLERPLQGTTPTETVQLSPGVQAASVTRLTQAVSRIIRQEEFR